MKNVTCSLVVLMAMLFLSTSLLAAPLNVALDSKHKTYKDTLDGNYLAGQAQEFYASESVAPSAIDKVILSLSMLEGSKPATARIYINDEEVDHMWEVSSSIPWTCDVSEYLQGGKGLTYEVQRKTGDFVFVGAGLNFQTNQPETIANPIPPAAILFGCGLIGLVGIRWKTRK